MAEEGNTSESRRRALTGDEYTAPPGVRHRSAAATRRLIFFSLASIWGFAVGVGGLLAAMSAAGQQVQPVENAIFGLIPAFIVAVAGAFVMAAAYKEAQRRSR